MIRRILAVLVPFVLLVACSSPADSGQESQGGGGGGESAAESAAASTGGGGGSATTACELITAAEVATVMGVAGTEAESVAGVPPTSYCNYRSDGTLVAATSFSTQDAEVVFGAWESDGPAVSGIGDKAVYSNSSGTLYFVSGSNIMGITAGGQDNAEQLGRIAADRL